MIIEDKILKKLLSGLCVLSAALSASPLLADEYTNIRDKLQVCFTCHGPLGASTGAGESRIHKRPYPILAGQHYYYLYTQLKDFKAGRRENPEMSPMAANLTKEEMQALAKFFSEQAWPNIGFVSDPDKAARGEVTAASGQCVQCHLGGYEGVSGVPRLAGQDPEYLKQTMLDYKSKARANALAKSSLMGTLSDEEIKNLADYLSGF